MSNVKVTVGGSEAVATAAGAPGLVAGVVQMKIQVPVGVQPGPAIVIVGVGGVTTNPVVTLAVR